MSKDDETELSHPAVGIVPDGNWEQLQKQQLFDRANQYDASNQPFPDGWFEQLDLYLGKRFWSPVTAANILCGLRPDRISYSAPTRSTIDPAYMEVLTRPSYAWKRDALERRYWKYHDSIMDAMSYGDITAYENPKVQERREQYPTHYGDAPEDPNDLVAAPMDILNWAIRNLSDIPAPVIDRLELSDESNDSAESQLQTLRHRFSTLRTREKNLIALLALLLENPNKYMRGSQIGIQRILDEIENIVEKDGRGDVFDFEKKSERTKVSRTVEGWLKPVKDKLSEYRADSDS